MYALLNVKNNKFFRGENKYGNCYEVDLFIEAHTFNDIKDAYYRNNLLKEEYRIVTIDEAKEMNKLY